MCVWIEDQDVQIQIEEDYEGEHRHVVLDGILTLSEQEEPKKGTVVFAHGSGSSGRHSPRNQYVASVLNNNSGIGTLLVDLLTEEEQELDERTQEYRFNIKLLANRLSATTEWLLTMKNSIKPQGEENLTIGYFGSSTGAAAALIAAVQRPALVRAIVSRGGRPDLADSSYLKKVQAPTLLLVGSEDNTQVIAWNQKSLQQLKNCKEKRLVMVPGAGHLFEEPGTLEEAARHAASWFERYLL
jgi:putative phosphoribosyl transferase